MVGSRQTSRGLQRFQIFHQRTSLVLSKRGSVVMTGVEVAGQRRAGVIQDLELKWRVRRVDLNSDVDRVEFAAANREGFRPDTGGGRTGKALEVRGDVCFGYHVAHPRRQKEIVEGRYRSIV